MGKLQRNAMGGVLALIGAWVVVHVIQADVLGWFLYCAAVGLGANLAHGQADSAAIAKGLAEKK